MTLIKSMTGYGRAVETVSGREFTVELRSVNNRYLDCTVKLPRSVSFAEDTVKQAVKQAGIKLSDIDAVAATCAPGLIGALLVGANFAKAKELGDEIVDQLIEKYCK